MKKPRTTETDFYAHQSIHTATVTPEVQKSKACLVEQSLGWTFDELVQRTLRNPETNHLIRASIKPDSKRQALQSLADGNICYTHPMYMTDRESTDFLHMFDQGLEGYQNALAKKEALMEQAQKFNENQAREAEIRAKIATEEKAKE